MYGMEAKRFKINISKTKVMVSENFGDDERIGKWACAVSENVCKKMMMMMNIGVLLLCTW